MIYLIYKRTYLLFFIVGLAGFSGELLAQCNPPATANFSTTASTCINNGAIHVTGVSGGGTASSLKEYSITASSNPNQPLIAYQSDSNFNSLYPGTYTVSIRYNCAGTYSTAYSNSVTITGSYQNISASFSNIRTSYCNNGGFTVNASNGYIGITGSYSYQLVSAQNATQPDPMAVSPVQDSNTFSNLAAGTYSVRIFDDCGNFITNNVSVPQGTPVNPFQGPLCNAYRFIQNIYSCDSVVYSYNGVYLNDFNNISYPIKFITIMPDNIRDTVEIGSASSFFYPNYNITNYINNAQFGPFYQQIVDDCNNVYTSYKLVLDTAKSVSAGTNASFECDGLRTTFGAIQNCNSSCPVPLSNDTYKLAPDLFGATNFEYSLDSGISWVANNADTILDYDQPYRVYLRLCNAVYISCNEFNIPQPVFEPTALEDNSYACNGNSGMYIYGSIAALQPGQVRIDFTQIPAGQVSIPPLQSNGLAFNGQSNINYLYNLVPGTYVYTITDTLCGRTVTDTITLSHPHTYTITAAAQQSCTQGDITVELINNTYVDPFFGGISPWGDYIANAYTFRLINNSGNVVNTQTFNSIPDTFTTSFTNLASNTYHVVVIHDTSFFHTSDTCPIADTVVLESIGAMNVSASDFLACGGTLGSIAITTVGGLAPYTYELYNGTVAPGNLIITQSDPLFNGLNATQIYAVRVIDNCGSGVTVSKSFAPLVPQILLTGTACVGDPLDLYVDSVAGASYIWDKDGISLSTDTNVYQIASLTAADYGNYSVTISVPGCADFSSSLFLDSNNCNPLPVSLLSFDGSIEKCQAMLYWKTVDERYFDHFNVQYSDDAIYFKTIGKLAGRNEMNNEYEFSTSQLSPKGFYRLEMISVDGEKNLSNVIVLNGNDCNNHKINWSIYPNPFDEGKPLFIKIDAGMQLESTSISITDLLGKNVFNKSFTIGQSRNVLPLDISGLNKGVYIINLYDHNRQVIGEPQKLVIQ